MANQFRANYAAAEMFAADLRTIGADLAQTSWATDGAAHATGSAKIAGALQEFFSGSSDSRAKMQQLLQRASGLLNELACEGRAIDRALGDAAAGQGSR